MRTERPPQRVVVFPPVLWTYVTLERSAGHVAGIAGYLRRDARDGLLDVMFPKLDNVPVVATRGALTAIPAGPEELMRLDPDMVVSWKQFAAPLAAVGLPVLEVATNRKSERAAMLGQWRAIAAAIGRLPLEDSLAARYRRDLASIVQGDATTRPTTLVVSRSAAGTFPSDACDILAIAGGRPPRGAPITGRLSDEELLRIDPDVLVLRCCADAEDTPAAVYADARFAPMAAVRSRRVYLEPSGSFRMEGLVQEPLLDEWLAELLHPARPRRLVEQLVTAYQEHYGYSLDKDQVGEILHDKENRASSGYDRFE